MRVLLCLAALFVFCPQAMSQTKPPEITVAAVVGKAECKKIGGSWEALKKDATFEIKDAPSFRTYDGAEVTLQFMGDSTVTLSPWTHVFLSENERRELSMAYGLISVVSLSKDRADLQIRTLGGLVRGPDSRFWVGVSPLGRSYVFAEKSLVYIYDEESNLLTDKKTAEAKLEALLAKKDPPKEVKPEPTKIAEGEAFQFELSASINQKLPAEKSSMKGLQTLIQGDPSTWDSGVPSMLSARLKGTMDDLSKAETLIKSVAAFKEKNLSAIEALKVAKAANDQAAIKESQTLITAQSRIQLNAKRLSHLLSLEARLQLEALAFIGQQSPKNSDAQRALSKNAATLTALSATSNTLAASVSSFRPRTRTFLAPAPTTLPQQKPTID